MLDLGVLVPLDAAFLRRKHAVGDEAIVEWRALTVIALDRIADRRARRARRHGARVSARAGARRWHLGGRTTHCRNEARRRRTPRCRSTATAPFFDPISPESAPCRNTLTVVGHPLILHKLTHMRRKDTSTEMFRRRLGEIAQLLAYEVTRDLPLELVPIETPLTAMMAPQISGKKLCLVSILRAGNGMLDGMLEILPRRAGRPRRAPRRAVPGSGDARACRVLLQGAGRHR